MLHLVVSVASVNHLAFFLSRLEKSFFTNWEKRSYTGDDSMKMQHVLFDRLCPLLIIRLLPMRVFNDLDSSVIYGQLLDQGVIHGMFCSFCGLPFSVYFNVSSS